MCTLQSTTQLITRLTSVSYLEACHGIVRISKPGPNPNLQPSLNLDSIAISPKKLTDGIIKKCFGLQVYRFTSDSKIGLLLFNTHLINGLQVYGFTSVSLI